MEYIGTEHITTEGDKKHGQGTHTYPDGSKYEGEYKDDWELNGTQYDKNGNIKYKYVNGKQIKQ